MINLIKVMVLPYFALLDTLTTHIAFRVSYSVYGDAWYAAGEANELMDGVIQHWWGVLLKMVVTCAVAVVFYLVLKRYANTKNGFARTAYIVTNIILLGATLFMLSAPIWNIVQVTIMLGWLN